MTAAAPRNGAAAILEFARTRGIDNLFCSPIAVLAPLWEAIAGRRDTAPRRASARRPAGTPVLPDQQFPAHVRGVATDLRAGVCHPSSGSDRPPCRSAARRAAAASE